MYHAIVTMAVFLFWICHGWILYTIDQFCQHRFGYTLRNDSESATRGTQPSQDEGIPRHDHDTDLISSPERQSVSLDSDCPRSRTNTENMKIDHSMTTDDGMYIDTKNYIEMLEEHEAVRHEIYFFEKKFQQLSLAITGLEETQHENEELKQALDSLRARAHVQEKQHQIAETQLMNENVDLQQKLKTTHDTYSTKIALITAELEQVNEEKLSQTFALDLAMDTVNARMNRLDELETELHDLNIKLQKQSSVQEENARLKEQVTSLRETESKLMNDKEILESKLHSLDSDNRIITNAKEAAEQSAQHAEMMVDEQLKAVEKLNFDLDLANAFISERVCIIDQLHNELSEIQHRSTVLDRQNKEMKIVIEKLNGSIRKRHFGSKGSEMIFNAQNEELKKKMDHLLTQNRALTETNSQLNTELEFANAEIANLRQTVTQKEQQSIEFRKETEILRAESKRKTESCKASSFSPDKAAKSVEQQASTQQSLLLEFDPLCNDIPVRFPRSNWVSDFDEIDPLKVEIHELDAKVRYLELLNDTLISQIEKDTEVEEELRQTITDLKEHNYRLVRMATTHPAQLLDRATTYQESALSEPLDFSEKPLCYENEVAEDEERTGEFGMDVTRVKKNLGEKKKESKLKRWLDKREPGKQTALQDIDVVKQMQGTANIMIQKAKKLTKKAKDFLGK